MLRFLRFGVHNVRLPRKTLPDEKIFTDLPSDDWGGVVKKGESPQ